MVQPTTIIYQLRKFKGINMKLLLILLFTTSAFAAVIRTDFTNSVTGKKEHGFSDSVEKAAEYVAKLKGKYKLKDDEYTSLSQDITTEMDAVKAERLGRRNERQFLKGAIQAVRDYDETCVNKSGVEVKLQPIWLKRKRIYELKYMKD